VRATTVWLLVCILGLVGLGYFAFKTYPDTVVESGRSTEFVLDKPFDDIRKAMRQGRFEKENLKINNAVVLEKRWVDKHFRLERPLLKALREKKFEFTGTLYAKVYVDSPKAGKITVELVQEIRFAWDGVEIHTTLVKPLDIGLTNMTQDIVLTPMGNQTKVELKNHMRLQRFIPKSYKDFAQRQMDNAAFESIQKMETVLRGL
jgi:hypothetical protein